MKNSLLFLLLFLHLFTLNSFAFTVEKAHHACRRGVMEMATGSLDKSAFKTDDLASDLVDDPEKMVTRLDDMEKLNLLKKELDVLPWSDSYWPIYAGMLGHRFNDPQMQFLNFKDFYNYFIEHPVSELLENKKFGILSPSEKYDYVFSTGKKSLTLKNWEEGLQYQNQYGKVESWMGLCHGWAAAAIMLPAPKETVEVNVEGNIVPFYSSDVKALGTLLFANGKFETRFIGGRCNDQTPKTDNMGRPIAPDCLDTNPGTWHLAVVNQLGVMNRSMVIDATYDYQVWNQPLASYEYSYYNVKNNRKVKTFKEALVKRNEWNRDPRAKVRASNTEYLVGINMNIQYVRENTASTEENQETQVTALTYEYDLELDRDYNIIGGEWITRNHPDFLWVPVSGSFPRTHGDQGVGSMDVNSISESHKKAARGNVLYNLPFGPFVKAMFEHSRQ